MTLNEWLQVGPSVLTAGAAMIALIIAGKAPKWAAQWAEQYRVQSEKANERERLRMFIFVSLMKCRKQILHPEAIAALNLIDVAFIGSREVRDAYRSFTEATLATPHHAETIVERYHVLIDKVAREMGVNDQISIFDIRNGYYPEALGMLDAAALAEAEEKIARRQLQAAEEIINPFDAARPPA